MIKKVVKKQNNSHDCIICGLDNPASAKARFYSMEDETCVALVTFDSNHQSYPSRTHGGMVTALLDEVIGRALWVYDDTLWGVTMKIEVEFHAPAPYGEELIAVGKITKRSKLFFDGVAELYDKNGKLLDRAKASYMILSLEKAAQDKDGHVHLEDVSVFDKDDVKEIDVPELKALRSVE